MSTSLLYHGWGLRGYQYVRTSYEQCMIRFSVQQDRYVEIPTEELKARFSKNAEIVAKLSNRDPHNLEYIQLDPGSATKRQGPMMVDPVHGKLVAKPRLALSADKLQLAGDGQDTARIEISVLDESGNAMSGASGIAAELSRAARGLPELPRGDAGRRPRPWR